MIEYASKSYFCPGARRLAGDLLLSAVQPESIYYDEARSIVKFLNYFVEANVEDEIPPTSILRVV